MPTTAAIIVAAGRGSRAGGAVPKQYVDIAGRSVLARTLGPFLAHPEIETTIVVIHPDDRMAYERAVDGLPVTAAVDGGTTRQASVLAGLAALENLAPDYVLIHDAARPFVGRALISQVIAALTATPGAIAAEPLADTLKRQAPDGTIAGTIDRAGLWRAQTPQGFRYEAILAAHRRAAEAGRADFTDDAAVAEWAGLPVTLVAGPSGNIKLTTADDLDRAAQMIAATQAASSQPAAQPTRSQPSLAQSSLSQTPQVNPTQAASAQATPTLATPAVASPAAATAAPAIHTGLVRTGLGFDVHPFDTGDAVWLGGVRIPHTHKLAGHSDADVALHALTDALLGTIGDGDIGQHFPPSDMRWKGAASILFLEDAARRVRERGCQIVNVDLTILAEAPRIGPHRPAMQATIAAALGLTPNDVGIKATTTEQLGFVGRREGIAAMAVATVVMGAGSGD